MTTFWSVVASCALHGLYAVVSGMSDAPGVADRFLLADRAGAIQEVLTESRTRLTDAATLVEVEQLVGSVGEYVPARSWPEVLLRDRVLTDLLGDFLDRMRPNLTDAMLPRSGGFESWLGNATPGRVRRDDLLTTLLEDPARRGEMSLFARRLVGEVLSVAQRLAARHQDLTSVLTGSEGGEFDDLSRINEVMAGVLESHDERMIAIGLEP